MVISAKKKIKADKEDSRWEAIENTSRAHSRQVPELRLNSGLLSHRTAPLWGTASLENASYLTILCYSANNPQIS